MRGLLGKIVIIDLASRYVALGKLIHVGPLWLELKDADLHDLRDGDVTRDGYVAMSLATGIKRNRKFVRIALRDVVAVARAVDVVDY